MKVIFSVLVSILIFSASAGEFSKIDQEVRETIIRVFDVDWNGNQLNSIDYDNDIWNLEVIGENTESCLMEVRAYFNMPDDWESSLSVAWVCINRKQNGTYEGDILDYDRL